MSAKSSSVSYSSMLRLAIVFALTGHGISAIADEAEEQEMPHMDFLEYLGSWQESDEDWLILNDAVRVRNELEATQDGVEVVEERKDPVPEGKESTESDDEY